MEFRFVWRNDDHCDVFLDDNHLFVVDYDMLGRSGMSHMLDAIRYIAELFSVEVTEVEQEWDDEDDA
jgi:hypothetical protein